MADKPKKNPFHGVERGRYWEARTEGRGRNKEHVVLVWAGNKKEGEAKEEWGMPGILPLSTAVTQAIIQS